MFDVILKKGNNLSSPRKILYFVEIMVNGTRGRGRRSQMLEIFRQCEEVFIRRGFVKDQTCHSNSYSIL